jgi:leucyl/phenylalanyl-tRNA--protein transferase
MTSIGWSSGRSARPAAPDGVDEPGFSANLPLGRFGADELLRCYSAGVFPMGEARHDPRVFLVEPDKRGIIPLEDFHVSSRLRRTVRAEPFQIRVNTAFDAVVLACAASAPGREESWINGPIRNLYADLNARGHAHSIECWDEERLVGGLYGVSLGGAFFGESMFSRARDASKVALVHLVARLRKGGWRLLDAQFLTDHLVQFGAVEISQAAYLRRLKPALASVPQAAALYAPLSGVSALDYALQPTTQAS